MFYVVVLCADYYQIKMDDRAPLGRARGRGRGLDQRPAGQQPFQGPPAGGGVPPPTQVRII